MKKAANAPILHPLINNVLSMPTSSTKTATDLVNQRSKMSHRGQNNQVKSTEKGVNIGEKDNNSR